MALTPEIVNEATDFLRLHIAAGFMSREQMLEWTAENLQDGTNRVIDPRALGPVFDQLAAAQREAAGDWPAVTDCDRLDAAFDELNARASSRATTGLAARPVVTAKWKRSTTGSWPPIPGP
jgi:hypothetical protein